ncbi:MAG: hypothetical protein L0G59_03950 [Kocuria sp.]|nr:hypothetical protein [Kocuria sp.]MDN5618309.1 hypothetical protein [Kocuria sp.]
MNHPTPGRRRQRPFLAYRTVVESGAARLAAEADLQAHQRRGLRRALDAASAATPEEYRYLEGTETLLRSFLNLSS